MHIRSVHKTFDHAHFGDLAHDKLGRLGVLALQRFDIQPSVDQMREAFKRNAAEKCVA